MTSPDALPWAIGALLACPCLFVLFRIMKKVVLVCSGNYPKGRPISDPEKEKMIDDLEHIGCPEGLGNVWNEAAKDAPFTVLLTGASGYLGQLVLFMLLHRIQNDTSQNRLKHKILLLVRPKKDRMTAQERVDKIKNMQMFDSVRGVWDDFVRIAETSDMNLPNAGISDVAMKQLHEAKVTHLIHCAADVGFTKTLGELASVNISSSLHLQQLAQQWPSCKRMIYVSTAFVHPECGTPESPLPEQLPNLGGYDAMKLYESMQGDQKLAKQVMKELRFANNYVFTKCVSEHLLSRDPKTELAIVRPAVVGPAWMQPFAGWNGEKPSTASTLGLLIISRMCRVCAVSYDPFPLVPVDVCAAGVIHAMITPTKKSEATDRSDSIFFRNLIWGATSQRKFFSCDNSLTIVLQFAVAHGLLSHPEAALTTILSIVATAFPLTIPVLHQIFNRGLLLLSYYALLTLETVGLSKGGKSADLKILLGLVDVARLYEPFMARNFYFQSSMHLPESFDKNFFADNMAVAVHKFMTTVREKNEAKKLKKKAEKQSKQVTCTKPYPILPPDWHLLALLPVLAGIINYYGLWIPLGLFYTAVFFFNPVTDFGMLVSLIKRGFSGRYSDLPLRFNLAGLARLIWGIFVRGSFEVVLHYLDELLFPGYANCAVEEPVFMLGQPRSGTTKLLDVMALDSERFCALTLSEIRYPFLCLQYTFDFIAHIDKTLLEGSIAKFMKTYGLTSPMKGGVPEREAMRRISWGLHDEDEIMFCYHGCCHFMLAGYFPDPALINRVYQFGMMPEKSRQKFLQFHRKAVQKMLYRRGAGRTYMAKWVAGWNGQLDQVKVEYPDAKFVVIARDRQGSLRSWMKLQSLLSLEMAGNNVMDIPEAKQAIIDVNRDWFYKEIQFCKDTPRQSLHVLRFSDFVDDIPKQIGRIYDFLGKKIHEGSDFDNALRAERRKQTAHKKTVVRGRELYLSDEQIENEFPDLLTELTFS